MDYLKEISDGGEALLHAPAWLLLILALNLLGCFLQVTPIIPNRFNKFIGLGLVVVGIVVLPLIVPLDTFPPTQPHPKLLLGIIGCIFGIIAWFGHWIIFKYLVKKYFPQFAPQLEEQQPTNNQTPPTQT